MPAMFCGKIILLIFFFSTVHIFSQDNEIGIFAGGSNYIGDVGPTTYISPFSYNASTNYVGGVIFRKNSDNLGGVILVILIVLILKCNCNKCKLLNCIIA